MPVRQSQESFGGRLDLLFNNAGMGAPRCRWKT